MSTKIITKNDLKNILEEIVHLDGTDMSQQDLADFIDSLGVKGIQAVDYVVEQGTMTVASQTWTYRKWNSGVAEAWARLALENQSITATNGYLNLRYEIPNIFSQVPMAWTTAGGQGHARSFAGYASVYDDSGTFKLDSYILNFDTSAVSGAVWEYVYLKGVWK